MDLNYDQFNGDALIFKYNLDEYGNPISIKVDKEEKQVSVHGTIQLEYVPDEYNRVVILNEDNTQMTEVFNRDEIKPNTYYVDYNNGVVYLDKSQFGKTKIYNYYKKGLQLIGCSRIYDEHDVSGKHVVLTLQEIIDAGREALRFLLDIGDAKKVIELLESLIAEGKLTITNLENKKNECIQSINNAISQATQDKNEIVQEIQDNIQQAKDEVVNVAGNKEVIIRSSDWALNIDVYEKEISHNLNSENLHVTAKNSDTKEAVTIGYKILDKTRILLKSDEAINMSVILSASYYHATQTISDNIAEEVVKARKGELDLKTKIDSIDNGIVKVNEQLDNKASKDETQNIQEQVNSLVLGAVGDGNNAEVVQARGGYNLLNDRLLGDYKTINNKTENIKDILLENKLATEEVVNKNISASVTNSKNMQINGSGYCVTVGADKTYNILEYTLKGEKRLRVYCSYGSDTKYSVGFAFCDNENKVISQYNNPSSGSGYVIADVPKNAIKIVVNGTNNLVPTIDENYSSLVSLNLLDSTYENIKDILIANNLAKEGEVIKKIDCTPINGKNMQINGLGYCSINNGDSTYNILQYTLKGEKKLRVYCSYGSDTKYSVGFAFCDDNLKVISQYNNSTSGSGYVIADVPEGATQIIVNGTSGLVPMIDECYDGLVPTDIKENVDYMKIFQRIAVIGDSLSSGELVYQDDGGEWQYVDKYGNSWLSYIAREIKSVRTHYSQGGLTAKVWLDYYNHRLSSDTPYNAYFIALGTNDAYKKPYPLGTISDVAGTNSFVGYYKQIIENVKTNAPNSVIFCCSRYSKGDSDGYNAMIKSITELYDSVFFVDIANESDITLDIAGDYVSGSHFTTLGYVRLAKNIMRIVSNIILNNMSYFKFFLLNNDSEEKYQL